MDETQPHIQIEVVGRGTCLVKLVWPDGRVAQGFIDRTENTADVLDYFAEKLKDGINV